jgi:hypothetical protein
MFHVGQLVVCVDDNWPSPRGGYGDELLPIRGKIYTVREVFQRRGDDEPSMLLEEVVNDVRPYLMRDGSSVELLEPSFVLRRFHPVDNAALDVFRQTTVKIGEDA